MVPQNQWAPVPPSIRAWVNQLTYVPTSMLSIVAILLRGDDTRSLNGRNLQQKISNRCPRRVASRTRGWVEKNTQQRTGVSLAHSEVYTIIRRTGEVSLKSFIVIAIPGLQISCKLYDNNCVLSRRVSTLGRIDPDRGSSRSPVYQSWYYTFILLCIIPIVIRVSSGKINRSASSVAICTLDAFSSACVPSPTPDKQPLEPPLDHRR